MAKTEFTEAAWLKELVAAQAKAPEKSGYMTKREISRATGIPEGRVLQLLHVAKDAGRLDEPRNEPRMGIDGKMHSQPVYRVRKAKP